MPQFHSPEQIKADQARVKSGKCPECDAGLGSTKAAVLAHRDYCLHSGHLDRVQDTDHARRFRVLTSYADTMEAKD
jgi:hypothetical protein